MGSRLPRLPAEARVIPASSNTTVVVKPPLTLGVSMAATRVGKVDARWQQYLLHKPAQSLVMTFSADPHLGVVADRFSGDAVVFLATATFRMQTASLR